MNEKETNTEPDENVARPVDEEPLEHEPCEDHPLENFGTKTYVCGVRRGRVAGGKPSDLWNGFIQPRRN